MHCNNGSVSSTDGIWEVMHGTWLSVCLPAWLPPAPLASELWPSTDLWRRAKGSLGGQGCCFPVSQTCDRLLDPYLLGSLSYVVGT